MGTAEVKDYYSIEAVSNSLLGRVWNIINGTEQKQSDSSAFEFGTQLHQKALEPHKYDAGLLENPDKYLPNVGKIRNMVRALNDNALFAGIMKDPKTLVEFEHFWHEPMYDLQCKLKADIFQKDISVADVKSTDATGLSDFTASIEAYHYYRQAAYYMDALGVGTFIFFGVSNHATAAGKHRTFTVIMGHDDPLIKRGREEYEYLMGEYLKLKKEGRV